MRISRILGLAGLIAAAVAGAAAQTRIVTVTYRAHQVEVLLPPAADAATPPPAWRSASLNQPIVQGESLRTGAASAVEVQLECGTALRLTPSSELSFPELRQDGKTRRTTVRLVAGEAYFTVQDNDSRGFSVLLPGGVVTTPHHGARLRLAAPLQSPATVEVLHGKVEVRDGSRTTEVKSSHRVELAPGRQRALPPAPADEWTQWSHQRDEAFQRELMKDTLISLVPTSPPYAAPPSTVGDDAVPTPPPKYLSPRPRHTPYCAHT